MPLDRGASDKTLLTIAIGPSPGTAGEGWRSRGGGFLLLLLCALVTHAATPAAGPKVALPDSGTYAYWVQSKAGAVSTMPVATNGQAQVTLPASAAAGDTLYVLDKHSGSVATLSLPAASTKPLSLAVGDFKPIQSSASSPAAPTPPTPAPAPHAETNSSGSGIERLITALFGLIVAAGVGWALWHLYQTRGRPLILAARRLGVDVPDPAAPDPEPEAMPVYTPPAPRPVEKIPEEAGAIPPTPTPSVRRASVGTLEAPQMVGIQGIAAGSSFVVAPGEVTIGRDGDNGIVLAESTVSRRHARLMRDAEGHVTLTDEGSANGIYVNGKRVSQTVLTAGDQIQIGDSYFRFEA